MIKYVKANEDHLGTVEMEITFGYSMSRSEVERELSKDGYSIADYDGDEEAAYREAAENKFNHGLGCYARIL
jgi:hypothetical protein